MKKNFAQEARSKVHRLTDGLNKPLDPNIKDLVAALLCQGIETVGSCEGHHGWGLPYPWVEIARKDIEPLRGLLKRAREDRIWEVWVRHPRFGRVLLRPKQIKSSLRRMQKRASVLGKKMQAL